jgi:radical SAM protein with 4Fe4S-binding SPASM domain
MKEAGMMDNIPDIRESGEMKRLKSPDYNYLFCKDDGKFWRWGKEEKDDPDYSPYGPELADIEIGTLCSGINDEPCSHCYKSNGFSGNNMFLDTFKKVFHNLNRGQLTQIAFGIGDIDSNQDMFKIMEYCRIHEVIPNITINGARLTETIVNRLTSLCGAIAVSRYNPKDICYSAVERLTNNEHKQINIHQLVSLETYEDCLETMEDIKADPRLSKLNALVFLSLKPKGNRNKMTKLPYEKWKKLIDKAFEKKIPIGFDSCAAPIFMEAVKGHKNYDDYKTLIEPCESLLFSVYVNVKGEVYPCSFLEETRQYICDARDNDLEDIWHSTQSKGWREKLLGSNCYGCRSCPVFDIY